MRRYRVVQWATGAVGMRALRAIAKRPDMELVGVFVHSPDKAGRDAGDLAGLGPLGVTATDRVDDILECPAECVLYSPLPSLQTADPDRDRQVICALLASGKNVVTTTGFVYPQAHGPEYVEPILSACRRGNATVHGTGANPGFLSDLLPIALSGLCDRIDQVVVTDSAEFSTYPSRPLVESLGLGVAPREDDDRERLLRRAMDTIFTESIALVCAAIGLAWDRVEATHEIVVAPETIAVAAGVMEAGTVAARRGMWSVSVGGSAAVQIESIYKLRDGVADQWPDSGACVRVKGRPDIVLDLKGPWWSSELHATVGHAVNAIPAVTDAPPGIATFLDLPPITGRWSGRSG